MSLIDFGNYLIEFARKEIFCGLRENPSEDSFQPYRKTKVRSLHGNISSVLSKVLVMKLSGGLGTGKCCKGPKTLVNMRNENTFLDLAVKQIEHLNKTYDADVHLVSMTSSNMDGDTIIFQKYFYIQCNHCCGKFYAFNQSRY